MGPINFHVMGGVAKGCHTTVSTHALHTFRPTATSSRFAASTRRSALEMRASLSAGYVCEGGGKGAEKGVNIHGLTRPNSSSPPS